MTTVSTVGGGLLDEHSLVKWGEAIGKGVRPPTVLTLRGDLGIGKTTLARAIARGTGVVGAIPSPTYNLLFRYAAKRDFSLVHLDLYRIENEDEVWELGWSELPSSNEVVIIEWPDRAESLLPIPRWEVVLTETEDPEERRVLVSKVGDPLPIALPISFK